MLMNKYHTAATNYYITADSLDICKKVENNLGTKVVVSDGLKRLPSHYRIN